MQLGIKSLEWIDSRNLHDYSQLAPGSVINLANYIKTGCSFTALPLP